MREINNIAVSEVMTKDVITITPNTTVKELKELFEREDHNAFPVVKGGKLVGIVSKLDFLRIFTMGTAFHRGDYWKLFADKVEDVMRKAVVSVVPEDSLKVAVEYMVEFNLRSLPIVDGEDLVGIISRGDVMSHLSVE
jgi:CBS domain-containing protein